MPKIGNTKNHKTLTVTGGVPRKKKKSPKVYICTEIYIYLKSWTETLLNFKKISTE